jgi:acyl-CoA thioester hydrolase
VTPARFEHRERIRWSDCDPMGIIWYGAYLRLFEAAEFELLRSCGLPFDVLRLERGVWLPRRAFSAEFHSPAQMDEEVAVAAWVAHIGTTSLTWRFEVYRASDRAHRASAKLIVVSVEKDAMIKRPIPDAVRQQLALYTIPD